MTRAVRGGGRRSRPRSRGWAVLGAWAGARLGRRWRRARRRAAREASINVAASCWAAW